MKKVSCFLFVFLLLGSIECAFSQSAGPLRVGAAKVDFTPSKDALPPAFTYIHDHLFSRAIVIDNGKTEAALINVDQGMLSNDFCKYVTSRAEKELGIPANNIFIAATHTHAAPRGNIDIEKAAFEAVKEAKENLKPALISYKTGLSYLNINRDVIDPVTRKWTQGPNYNGPSDKTVAVITFTGLDGKPIAVYYNYAMHANSMFMSGAISADFPGVASKYIENYYGGHMVAMYTTGAAGDQNPISVMPMKTVSREKAQDLLNKGIASNLNQAIMMAGFQGKSHLKVDQNLLDRQAQMISSLGQLLAEEVLRVMSLPQVKDSSLSIYSSQKMISCPGRIRTNTGREGSAGTYKDGPPVNIKLSLLRLGHIALTGVDAEVYTKIGEELKAESPYGYTIFSTITNGHANSGYIPTDNAFHRYTFQVLSSSLKPGCAEESIINGLVGMMDTSMDNSK